MTPAKRDKLILAVHQAHARSVAAAQEYSLAEALVRESAWTSYLSREMDFTLAVAALAEQK